MHGFVIQFAAADLTEKVKDVTTQGRFDAHDELIAISIGVAIGTALFIWAYLRFRKKPEVILPGDSPREKPVPAADDDTGGPERRRKRKKRRRRREHRPRNPSLQQTGGLPPPRPEDELPRY